MNKKASKKIRQAYRQILCNSAGELIVQPIQGRTPRGKVATHINPFKEMKRIYNRNGKGERGLSAAREYALDLLENRHRKLSKK